MEQELLSIFFPSGVLEYFEVSLMDSQEDQYTFFLKEKNIAPEGYSKDKIESKGFYDGGQIKDFPLRGKRCVYKVRRRKWIEKQSRKTITRDWNIVAKGTRTTGEFAAFLKELNR